MAICCLLLSDFISDSSVLSKKSKSFSLAEGIFATRCIPLFGNTVFWFEFIVINPFLMFTGLSGLLAIFIMALILVPSCTNILSSVEFVVVLFIESDKVSFSSLFKILRSFICIPIRSLVNKSSLLLLCKLISPLHFAFPETLLVKSLPNTSLIKFSPI